MRSKVMVERRMRTGKYVLCFEGEVRQVISNLINNAIDAMPPHGGRLLLRTREATDHAEDARQLVITVADTGGGISPQAAKNLFEPFFTTKEFTGTGLGLWISREIMTRHGGSIRVRSSQRLGRSGTVFTIALPKDDASSSNPQFAVAEQN